MCSICLASFVVSCIMAHLSANTKVTQARHAVQQPPKHFGEIFVRCRRFYGFLFCSILFLMFWNVWKVDSGGHWVFYMLSYAHFVRTAGCSWPQKCLKWFRLPSRRNDQLSDSAVWCCGCSVGLSSLHLKISYNICRICDQLSSVAASFTSLT